MGMKNNIVGAVTRSGTGGLAIKIRRCPDCATPNPLLVRIHPLRWIFTEYYVECWYCHYCGATKIGKRRAIKTWNRIKRRGG